MYKHFLSDSASLAEFESHMPLVDHEAYMGFKHLKSESAFVGRVFLIFKQRPIGLNGITPPPLIVGAIKVIDFYCDNDRGATVTVQDVESGLCQCVTHVPARCFDYDFFLATPIYTYLRYDAKLEHGEVTRSLLFGLLLKTQHRADYFSEDATYVETPNAFRSLFPEVELPELN